MRGAVPASEPLGAVQEVRSFFVRSSLVVTAALSLFACSDEAAGPNPDPGVGTGGASPGSGGVSGPSGGTSSGGAGVGGAAPAGQLRCGGQLCHSGGQCMADGRCPPFLGACFSSNQFDTCDEHCSATGFECAMKFCNTDGSPIEGGYSWVSYPQARQAECAASATPEEMSFDQCRTPIWLNPSKAIDDVVRCCCRDRAP